MAKDKSKKGDSAEGTDLFPLPETPLGKAAKAFVNVTKDLAEDKEKKVVAEEAVLEEMLKEKRERLTVTVGNDNWEFTVKLSKKGLRCVKKTRQPKPKTVTVDE